jgi:hypothetical protein
VTYGEAILSTYKKQTTTKNVTKAPFSFLGFFAAHGLCAANQAEPRAVNSCPTSFPLACASANIYYAPAITQTKSSA